MNAPLVADERLIERLRQQRDMLARCEHIEAQQDETGRIWSGPRYKMPARFHEISNESGIPGGVFND